MIKIKHDLSSYDNSSTYYPENTVMIEKYVDYVDKYAHERDQFLELGIGHGHTVKLLSTRFRKITVIDGEKNFIDKYTSLFPDVTFIHSYFEDYYPKERQKNIGMGFMLELVDSPLALLRHYTNLLEKDGRIFVSVANAASLHRLIAREAGLLEDVKQMSEHHVRFNYQRFNTYSDWRNLFEQAELKMVASHGLLLKPFSTSQLNSLTLDDATYRALSRVASGLPEIANGCFFALER